MFPPFLCPHLGDKKPERRIFFLQLGISDTFVITSTHYIELEAGCQLVLLINLFVLRKNTHQIIRSHSRASIFFK